WSQVTELAPTPVVPGGAFGFALALSGDLAVVSAPYTAAGRAYAFQLSGLLGDTCSDGSTCPEGRCVDGVCCAETACTPADACHVAGTCQGGTGRCDNP